MLFLSVSATLVSAQSLVFNEWMTKNSTVIADEDGDHPDWIELFNGTSFPIDLNGYGLTDDEAEPFKWVFPSVIIPEQGFLLIFCSDKDRFSGPFLHTNFKLSSSDQLLLTNPSGLTIDQKELHRLSYDISEGFIVDGMGETKEFYGSTPGVSNLNGIIHNELISSHLSGFYNQQFNLLVTGSEAHGVHYTTNGSIPAQNDPVWTGSLLIDDR
ncbi:MAG: lamin tail domain-containing protein [Flavobacteriales bacterium]|nr:lamin tail domain-containing protein [Flavobacteriales bacterium]